MALYFGPSNDRYRVREPLGSKAAFLCLVSLGAGLNCAVMVTGVKGMGKSAVVGVFGLYSGGGLRLFLLACLTWFLWAEADAHHTGAFARVSAFQARCLPVLQMEFSDAIFVGSSTH